MSLQALLQRLTQQLSYSVRSGETTERALAFRLGISQPHLHNVLKGCRPLTVEVADRVLAKLRLHALDLFEYKDLVEWQASERYGGRYRELPLPADRRIRLAVPLALLSGLRQPALFPLPSGDVLLLDQHPDVRANPRPEMLYWIECPEGSGLRLIREGRNTLYYFEKDQRNFPERWRTLRRPEFSPLQVVRGEARAQASPPDFRFEALS